SEFLTRLNTRPALSLVNASTPPSRAAPHDSGPMWVATSHSYDSFIHYTSPVYPAHKESRNEARSRLGLERTNVRDAPPAAASRKIYGRHVIKRNVTKKVVSTK